MFVSGLIHKTLVQLTDTKRFSVIYLHHVIKQSIGEKLHIELNSITKLFHPKGLIMGCWGFMIFCLFFFTVVNGIFTALFTVFPIMLGCCFLGVLQLVDFILFCFNETTKDEDGSVNQTKNIKICVILSISLFFLHIALLVCRSYFLYTGKLQNVL